VALEHLAALGGGRGDGGAPVVGIPLQREQAIGREGTRRPADEGRLEVRGRPQVGEARGPAAVERGEDRQRGSGQVDAGPLGPQAVGGPAPDDADDAGEGLVDPVELRAARHGARA
jgi:hypothetical protein